MQSIPIDSAYANNKADPPSSAPLFLSHSLSVSLSLSLCVCLLCMSLPHCYALLMVDPLEYIQTLLSSLCLSVSSVCDHDHCNTDVVSLTNLYLRLRRCFDNGIFNVSCRSRKQRPRTPIVRQRVQLGVHACDDWLHEALELRCVQPSTLVRVNTVGDNQASINVRCSVR